MELGPGALLHRLTKLICSSNVLPSGLFSHHLLEDCFRSFLITSTQLCGSTFPLQLAHPLANEPRAMSEFDAPRIEGCKKLDRLAVY
jgi:hypothetical protein